MFFPENGIMKAEGMENLDQPKPDPKGKAIASFCLGAISTLIFLFYSCPNAMTNMDDPEHLPPTLLSMLLFTIVSPIGLMLGIKGIRSTERTYAIVGIVLSMITLLPLALFLIIIASFNPIVVLLPVLYFLVLFYLIFH